VRKCEIFRPLARFRALDIALHQGPDLLILWSGRRDLNPRPLDPQSSALPNWATSRCYHPRPTVRAYIP
jgi:hypothetical protein